ncbi:putative malate dehydrogenase [Mycena belliarum]|uniref:Malate dehydrogenase n=1 Tax=Mycena belliarum TaxID=1033014 RepID=A0AAD6UN94_9AGAR|nr:putative malate dehydrogenase [Mycena belliae]
MLALTLLPLFLSCVAASEHRGGPPRCDISAAKISLPPNQTMLVAPKEGPSFIGLAIGIQNYTCADSGTFTNIGAVAELFDVSCLSGTPEFPSLANIVFSVWDSAPPATGIFQVIDFLAKLKASFVLGQHYFVTSPSGTGISPKWDFTSASLAGHPNAFVIGAKVGDIVAPTGPPDVDWLSLVDAEGDLATQIFRVNTVGGLPPTSCVPGSSEITVKYSSLYWLYGSSV